MIIKNDLISLAVNFVSIENLVKTLSELENESNLNVVIWLTNANKREPLPQLYNFDKYTGTMDLDGDYADGYLCELHDQLGSGFNVWDGNEWNEDGWLLTDIAPYLKARNIDFPEQGTLRSGYVSDGKRKDEQKKPVQACGSNSTLTDQPEVNHLINSDPQPMKWRKAFEYESEGLNALYDLIERHYFDADDNPVYKPAKWPLKKELVSDWLSGRTLDEADTIITSGQRKGKAEK